MVDREWVARPTSAELRISAEAADTPEAGATPGGDKGVDEGPAGAGGKPGPAAPASQGLTLFPAWMAKPSLGETRCRARLRVDIACDALHCFEFIEGRDGYSAASFYR